MTTSYDVVPYSGVVVPVTSAPHLALCSLYRDGPGSRRHNYRFAELGCGDGANLAALAFYNPESQFIGIDSSRAQIRLARQTFESIGLSNISEVLCDLRDLNGSAFALCDYIIAHGLYSWVSEDARHAIFRFCQRHLSPSGLAYVSYNAQPGWAVRNTVRETLMRSRAVRTAVISRKAEKAMELASQLLEDLPFRSYASATLLAKELERVRDGKPFYILHEYLADINEGFWLGDFVEGAQHYGLGYVADAQFCRWEGHVPAGLKATLAERSLDPVEQEEIADLLCDRYFRASILCRSDAPRWPVNLQDLLEKVNLATSISTLSDPFDLREGEVESFCNVGGPEISLSASITKAAAIILAAQWPRGMTLEALYAAAVRFLTGHDCKVLPGSLAQLSADLLTLFEAGQVDFRLHEPAFHNRIPDYPEAHALARYEAGHRDALTTPYHLPLPFDPDALAFVEALDGSRTRSELYRAFKQDLVDQTLEVMARWGLLAQ